MNKTKMFFNLQLLLIVCVLIGGFTFSAFGQKLRLRSQITPTCANTGKLKFADIYADGNIAVQGSYDCRGVFIYNVSNPDAPTLSSWYNPGANIQFLEAIVIGNRGYFGSGNGFGVHIVDLTNPANPVLLGTVDTTHGNGFSSIHEMVVFGNYLIENFNGFSNKTLKVIDISNPANPVFVRDIIPSEPLWVHAMHIRGNRMFTSGWGSSSQRGRTEIYDISNIATQAPTLLGFIEDTSSTTAGNNMHSNWTSEDGNYLFSARETALGDGDVRVYDVRNPAVPVYVKRLGMQELGLNAITPHNPVVMGNYLYVAWYQAGIQIFDISDPVNPRRVAQYDTYPTVFAPTEFEKQTLANAEPWDMICGSGSLQNLLPTTYDGDWAVFPFLGTNKILAGDLKFGLLILDASNITAPPKNNVSDFDGDGKTDYSRFNPTNGRWNIETPNSASNSIFGQSGDKPEAGDYDGDGRADFAVFRPANGTWYVFGSQLGFITFQFGLNGDVPVPADYDADGKMDFAVFRPSTGVWYVQQSTLGFRAVQWGTNGDKAFTGDYEGDGKADFAIWRPSTGVWYIMQSSSALPIIASWGLTNDKPVSGDFDGDGRSELAVYRPSDGIWYTLNLSANLFRATLFGIAEDVPIPADYDGDGKSDIAVFRPSDNVWYILNSTNGGVTYKTFGQSGDIASPSSAQPQ